MAAKKSNLVDQKCVASFPHLSSPSCALNSTFRRHRLFKAVQVYTRLYRAVSTTILPRMNAHMVKRGTWQVEAHSTQMQCLCTRQICQTRDNFSSLCPCCSETCLLSIMKLGNLKGALDTVEAGIRIDWTCCATLFSMVTIPQVFL